MTFHIYADTGEKGGPFASMPLAHKHARALLIGNKKCETVELRPALSSFSGQGYGPNHKLSFYIHKIPA